jgi:DNA-binding Lrp family transcriptional regulator
MMTEMDQIDRLILNRIQSDFPLTSRPFDVIAKELELTEQEVIQRLTRLKMEGIIRRIGGNFVPDKLGYVSTLCSAHVPEEKIPAFVHAVNRHPGVTHNYLREHHLNMWFTFIAASREEIAKALQEISEETGITDILNLPATRVFKIRALFDL